jgi:transposase, IS5 family
MGEEKLQALLQESLAVATRTDAMKPSDLARVVIDTTVQPKAVMFPVDRRLRSTGSGEGRSGLRFDYLE